MRAPAAILHHVYIKVRCATRADVFRSVSFRARVLLCLRETLDVAFFVTLPFAIKHNSPTLSHGS